MSTIAPMGPSHSYAVTSQKKRDAVNGDSPAAKATAAEQDANSRIQAAAEQVQDAVIAENDEINHVKVEGGKMEDEATERVNQEIQAQRNKGYGRLRDLQRQQNTDFNRTRRQGETTLNQETTRVKDAVNVAEREGTEKLNTTQRMTADQMHYETKKDSDQLEAMSSAQVARVKQLQENSEVRYSALNAAKEKEYNRMRDSSQLASEQTQQHFQENYDHAMAEDTGIINDLENRASSQIRDIRADTAEKLNAYSSRQSDPFYKMRDVAAQVHDTGDSYVLIARVPEHEQQHISVSIRGNEIALTGYRRNEEKLDIAPGRSKNTASFQSFSESFPLTAPVEAKYLQKEFDGDRLIVTVPKKPEYTQVPIYNKTTPDKVKVERPQFPENIPVGKYQARNQTTDETQAAPKHEVTHDATGKPLT